MTGMRWPRPRPSPDLPPWVRWSGGAVISSNRARIVVASTNSEGQRIVHELATSDEDAFPGRHRAPASAVRSLSVRMGIAALGILVATGLGAATADVLGLSDAAQMASQGSSPQGISPVPEEEPRPGRTTGLATRSAVPMPPEDLSVDPAPQSPPADAATAAAGRPAPVAGPPAPAPVRTVRTGDSCSAVGQTATTRRGDAAVCTASPGNGPNKWRAA